MIGTNELRLCAAEMHKAMQYYLDQVVFREGGKSEVVNIDLQDRAAGCGGTYVIRLVEHEVDSTPT